MIFAIVLILRWLISLIYFMVSLLHHFDSMEELMAEEKALSLRLPATLHKKIVALAEKDLRSVNAEIVFLLTKAIEGEK